ncbi:MAG: TetR/AcrR family transcriptional regulator [Paracoccaceae bacterium]
MPKIVDKEEMRNSILDAVTRVYTAKGYHAATIADVAEEAGLGKGTLYLYFKNKEAMTTALIERHFASIEQKYMSAPLPESLDAFIGELSTTVSIPDGHARFIRVFFEVFGPSFASEEFTKNIADFFERMGAHYAKAITHLQARGEVRDGVDAALFGRALASLIDGIILHRGLFGIAKKRQAKLSSEALSALANGLRV